MLMIHKLLIQTYPGVMFQWPSKCLFELNGEHFGPVSLAVLPSHLIRMPFMLPTQCPSCRPCLHVVVLPWSGEIGRRIRNTEMKLINRGNNSAKGTK